MMNDTRDAVTALEAMAQSRRRLAGRSVSPPIRHAAFAALMGVLVATPPLPIALLYAAYAVIFALTVVIVLWDRRRTGTFVNGFRAGRTRWICGALLVLLAPIYLASAWLGRGGLQVWPSIALGLLAGILSYAASLIWERAYLTELERGA